MQLDKDTLRKLRGLIIFTLVILVGLWRFSIVLQAVKAILHILFPFLLGGAIAFVLSVPMNRIRKRLFANAKEKQKKFAAPVSLILTLIFVLALLSLVPSSSRVSTMRSCVGQARNSMLLTCLCRSWEIPLLRLGKHCPKRCLY